MTPRRSMCVRRCVGAGIIAWLLGVASASPAAPDDVTEAGEREQTLAQRCSAATREVRRLLDTDNHIDAHLLAMTLSRLCPARALGELLILDALALFELDDWSDAQLQLRRAEALPETRDRAAVVATWLHLELGDHEAYRARLDGLPPPAQTRLRVLGRLMKSGEASVDELPLELRAPTRLLAADYRDRRSTRRPWLAGTLSAFVPGLGQAYAGSWEGAVIAFAINGVLIGATVELARERLYWASATTGLAASVFYVGNILNANDLAARRNRQATREVEERLRRLLVPELTP